MVLVHLLRHFVRQYVRPPIDVFDSIVESAQILRPPHKFQNLVLPNLGSSAI